MITEAEHQEAQRKENFLALLILSSVIRLDTSRDYAVTIPHSFRWNIGEDIYEIGRDGDCYADDEWNLHIHSEQSPTPKFVKTGTWMECIEYVNRAIEEYN